MVPRVFLSKEEDEGCYGMVQSPARDKGRREIFSRCCIQHTHVQHTHTHHTHMYTQSQRETQKGGHSQGSWNSVWPSGQYPRALVMAHSRIQATHSGSPGFPAQFALDSELLII